MGQLTQVCNKQSQQITNLVEQEKEVSLVSYKSNADSYYNLQENKYNYLHKMLFQDFLYSLVNFSNENATLEDDYNKANIQFSMNDPFFNDDFSTDYFQSFIENKVLKHKALYEDAGSNEKITSIFKECFLSVHNSLGLKLAQNAKQNGDESADKNTIIKKKFAIAYGLLYCIGPNYAKIKAIYNIFQQDDVLTSSQNFSDFLLALFLIPSYCMASARNKLVKFSEIGDIEKSKLKELLDSSELKDCQHLVEVVNKMIFGNDLARSYNYQDFKIQFADTNKDTSLAFLLSPSGIRYMLQQNNV